MNRRRFILASAAVPMFGQDATKTEGMMNGREWHDYMNQDLRLYMVSGFLDLAQFMLLNIEVWDEIQKSDSMKMREFLQKQTIPAHTTTGELIEKMNQVFAEPQNRVLPITSVFGLSCQIFNGVYDEAGFTKAISDVRRLYQQSK